MRYLIEYMSLHYLIKLILVWGMYAIIRKKCEWL